MIIKTKDFGKCQLEVQVEKFAGDSFVLKGYSIDLDRDLNEEELDIVQLELEDSIFDYAMELGAHYE